MKSWRMVALVLLGAQAGMVTGAAPVKKVVPATTPASPAAPATVPATAVPSDDVELEAAAVLATEAQLTEQRVAALIVRFNAAMARIKSSSTAEGRIAGYRDGLELFDQIRLDRADFALPLSLKDYVVAYIDELNTARRPLNGLARARNLNEARGVVLRFEDRLTRVNKLLDIARIESDSGDAVEALLTVQSILSLTPLLTTAQSDAAMFRAIGIAVRPGRAIPDTVYLWLQDIRAAALRTKGLRLIAEVESVKDKVLVELMGSSQLGADRDTRLLDISDFMTRKGRFDAATWTAMLTSDAAVKERDAALGVIVDDMVDNESDSFPAVHGITDAALRDRHLLDLVALHLSERRYSDARLTAGFLEGPTAAALGWARIGLWLQGKSHYTQAIAALDRAEALLAVGSKPAGASAAHDVAQATSATLAARLGQRPRARALMAQVRDTSLTMDTRLALVESAWTDRAESEAQAEIARIPAGETRETAYLSAVTYLLKGRRWDEVTAQLNNIHAPLRRLDALVAMIKALKPVTEANAATLVQPAMAVLLTEVETLAGKLDKEGLLRSEARALRAMARASNGEFAAARIDLQEALTAERFGPAYAHYLSRLTQMEGVDAGIAATGLGLHVVSREDATGDVAVAAAERGELERATSIARGLNDDLGRVETFREIAEVSAERTDSYDLINAAAVANPFTVDRSRVKGLKLLSKNSERQLFGMPNADLGKVLPSLPLLAPLTSRAMARDIPNIASGLLHVLPMQYSDFNEKFLPSLSYGFNDANNKVFYFDAQKTAFPVFLSLDEGVYDLPGIARFLQEIGRSEYLVREGRRYTLKLPILVGLGAKLVISGTDVEELRLVRNAGAFIVNAGHLYVHDTRIVGWDANKDAPAAMVYKDRQNFRPFIVNWSGSVADIAHSKITHLGFLGAKGYGLSYTSGPEELLKRAALNLQRPSGRVYDNSFQQMMYGLYTYEADKVLAVGNEYRDNIVYGLDPHDRSTNLLMAYNTSYGTGVKHGLIVSREVENSWIIGNLSFDNNGSGIMLDRDSIGNVVYANSSFMNKNDGVALFESPCNIIASNLVFKNKRDGIKARNSWDVGVFRNQVIDNGGAAVSGYVGDLAAESLGHVRDFELDPYFKISDIAVVDNLIKGNVGGVSLKGSSSFVWKGNEVVAQPRAYSGMTKSLVNDLFKRSDRGVYVRVGCPKLPSDYQCTFKLKGFLAGVAQYDADLFPDSICGELSDTRVAAGAAPAAASTTP